LRSEDYALTGDLETTALVLETDFETADGALIGAARAISLAEAKAERVTG
jgi:hypothetical protein